MNDYIKNMRKLIGHETLLTVGCGAIMEDSSGKILLMKRKDFGEWGIPGGLLEIGETFEETVKREVFEETNLELIYFKLFGIYSGKNGYSKYENGDKVFSVQMIFLVTDYEGDLQKNSESKELCFFSKDELPNKLNPHQTPFILDWMNDVALPVIR